MNKYCGEHLIVVNESPVPEPTYHSQRSLSNNGNDDTEKNDVDSNGPVAEALIQNEQMFHHLKILKPSPSEMQNERIDSTGSSKKQAMRKGVYSQVNINILCSNISNDLCFFL